MNVMEQTIDGVVDMDGQLQLLHAAQVPPGEVRVTIRAAAVQRTRRGLADVIREIADDQRTRGLAGRSPTDMRDEEDAVLDECAERDRELDAARRATLQ